MNTMNHVRKGLFAAVLSLGLGALAAPAMAQSAAPTAKVEPGRFGHAASLEERQARQARRAEHFAKRQAALHDALKLTAAQEGAWTTFVNATKPGAPPARPDRAELANLTAPQRIEQHLAFSRERTARMEQHLAAVKSFYAVLSPEQKKTFDEAMAKHGGHGHGRGGHHGAGMHG
jgi:Spy/CpxP family protein refolding chaperone